MKLLDSSVLIDIDQGGIDEKVERLDDQGRHAVSMVTVTELQVGVNLQYERGTTAHQRATENLTRLLARFELLGINRPVAVAAAEIITSLRQTGDRLDDLHDVYIGATAMVEQLPVLTSNTAHFERIEDVQVLNWQAF